MRLVIVSGLSGSGKSVALHELEDIDFYCVDNIPAALLKPFIAHTIRGTDEVYRRTAVGLDARNRPNEIDTIPALVGELKRSGIACEVLFLHASDEVLLKRYAETRRKHPLVCVDMSLREAIASERLLLEPIIAAADMVIDTSNMGVHALRERIRERIDPGEPNEDNLYAIGEDERRSRGIEFLPQTLQEAIASFAADPFIERTLGRALRDEFVHYKTVEWETYHLGVSAWEVERYSHLF